MGGKEGAPGFEPSPSPLLGATSSMGPMVHSSLTCQLRGAPPRAQLWENESRRPVSGLLLFCCRSPVCRGDSGVFLEDTYTCPPLAVVETKDIPSPGAA